MPAPLPPLPSTPTSLPHADSTLSSTLVSTLTTILPPSPALTISIGHGHGLLEAYLLQQDPTLNLLGVDVFHSSPQYLPESQVRILSSTSALLGEATAAEAWVFVYPKDLGLLGRYVQEYGDGAVKLIVWIGPRMDWEDVERGIPRKGWTIEEPGVTGLKGYEVLVLCRKDDAVRVSRRSL
ncbi:MAG: hypothetical protein LQ346_004368 [Caloplaca aetnensis]|nr:MAG: hypothetical protein LQ346_004368 [Caloplaca aetnensis]